MITALRTVKGGHTMVVELGLLILMLVPGAQTVTSFLLRQNAVISQLLSGYHLVQHILSDLL